MFGLHVLCLFMRPCLPHQHDRKTSIDVLPISLCFESPEMSWTGHRSSFWKPFGTFQTWTVMVACRPAGMV